MRMIIAKLETPAGYCGNELKYARLRAPYSRQLASHGTKTNEVIESSNEFYSVLAAWWRRSVAVSGVGLINEVNRHWARLVLGWVTVCGRVNHLGM